MTLRIDLEPDVDARLSTEAARRGLSKDKMAAKLINDSLPAIPDGNEDDADFILHLTEKIASTIPDEALDKVPTDLSKNVDHYLYGHTKQA